MNGLSFLKMEKTTNLVSFGGLAACLDAHKGPQTTKTLSKRRPYGPKLDQNDVGRIVRCFVLVKRRMVRPTMFRSGFVPILAFHRVSGTGTTLGWKFPAT